MRELIDRANAKEAIYRNLSENRSEEKTGLLKAYLILDRFPAAKLPDREPDRTYIVSEVCPSCESEIEMRWDTDTMGFQAFCPVCGNRLMLCDECQHANHPCLCDYDVATDSCCRRTREADDEQ